LPVAGLRERGAGTWVVTAGCNARTHQTLTNLNHRTPSSRENPPCKAKITSMEFSTCSAV
jgi:hypothetical protein